MQNYRISRGDFNKIGYDGYLIDTYPEEIEGDFFCNRYEFNIFKRSS